MLQCNFNPFPELHSERLKLRQLRTEDVQEIFHLRSDDKVNEFLGRNKANSPDDALEFIMMINNGIKDNQWLFWGIEPHQQDKIVGTICLWNLKPEIYQAEIGYELLPEHQHKGYMQEAVRKVLGFAFEKVGLKKIEAHLHADNTRSIKILERYNFRRNRDAERKIEPAEKVINTVIYTLIDTGEMTKSKVSDKMEYIQ